MITSTDTERPPTDGSPASGGDEPAAHPEPPAVGDRRDAPGLPAGGPNRWSTVAGLVLAIYLVAWMVRLVLVDQSPGLYDRTEEWVDLLGVRVALAVVVLAAVYHSLEGLRRLAVGLRPGAPGAAASGLARGAVVFLTWATVIPLWTVLLQPWIEDLV